MIKRMTTRANELKGLLLGLVLATVWASTSLAEIVPVIHYTDSVPGASPLVKSAYFKFAIVDMGISETRQGVTATATAIVSNGTVTSIVVNTFGSGYKTPPDVRVIGGEALAPRRQRFSPMAWCPVSRWIQKALSIQASQW